MASTPPDISRPALTICLTVIAVIMILLPSCGGDKPSGASATTVRLLDTDDLMRQVTEDNLRAEFIADLPLDPGGWETAGKGASAAGYTIWQYPVPEGCDLLLQNLQNTTQAGLTLDGAALPFRSDLEELLSSAEPSWTLFTQQQLHVNLAIEVDDTFSYALFLPVEQMQLRVDLLWLRGIHTAEIMLDETPLGTVTGSDANESTFRTMLKAEPGYHNLKVTIRSTRNNDRTRIPIKTISLGAGDMIMVAVPPGGLTPDRAEALFSYNRINNFRRKLHWRITSSEFCYRTAGFLVETCQFKARFRSIDGNYWDTRRTVNINPETKLNTRLALESNAWLDFGYGFMEGSQRNNSALVVRILSETDGAAVGTWCLPLNNIGRLIWYDTKIDLGRFAGQPVRLEFEYLAGTTGAGQEAHLFLAEPRIVYRKGAKTEQPNVILISLDTLRGDRLGVDGWKNDTTPLMDDLARQGVRFNNAWSQIGWTLPSHKSMLTGLYPLTVRYAGGRFGSNQPLPEQVPTLATFFRDAGYNTAAFVNTGFVSGVYGLHNGFDNYAEYVHTSGQEIRTENGMRIAKQNGWDAAYQWIHDNEKGGPFFLFLHTYSPHTPYSSYGYEQFFGGHDTETKLPADIRVPLPGGLKQADIDHINRVYDQNLRRTDDELNNLISLLKADGLLDTTILVITSDHGELLGEHKVVAEHGQIWNEVIRIPLIIRYPQRFRTGVEVDDNIELNDLVPTMLDIIGREQPAWMEGASLLPFLTGSESHDDQETVFSTESLKWSAMIRGGYKYHARSGKELLFDIASDPGEQNNLLETEPGRYTDMAADMSRRLAYYCAQGIAGWNIYILPRSNTDEKYRISITGYTFRDRSAGTLQQSFRLGRNVVHLNKTDMIAGNEPSLMLLEEPESGTFTIEIQRETADSGWEHVTDGICVGFRDGAFTSPLVDVPSDMQMDIPRVHAGIPEDLLEKFSIFIWRTPNPLGLGLGSGAMLSDEDNAGLKNLGYIQ